MKKRTHKKTIEVVQKSKKKSKKSKKRVEQYQRGTLIKSIYALFDYAGVNTVTYAETEKLARKIKPDTKFNKYHFSWYRNDYKNKRDIV